MHMCVTQPQWVKKGLLLWTKPEKIWHLLIGKLLTHWGRVMHICVSKQTISGSDNGFLPCRCQAISWTNAGILLIGPSGTNFSEILIEMRIFSFKKMGLKVSSAKWRAFCFGLNEFSGALLIRTFWYIQAIPTQPFRFKLFCSICLD